MAGSTQIQALDLQHTIDDLFLVLTAKEKEVAVKRFALDNPDVTARWTLERIGQKFGVTRERIRQIEKITLNKLRRTAQNTKLRMVYEVALKLMNQHGGLMTEDAAVKKLIDALKVTGPTDGNILRLCLTLQPELEKVMRTDSNEIYYHLKNITEKDVQVAIRKAYHLLEKKGDIVPEAKLLSDLALTLAQEDMHVTPEFMLSAMSTDPRFKKMETGGYGLMSWRHVNPKSIRDKAYIILKKHQKPLHFRDIADRIRNACFDQKTVTMQAVHNELIRYEHFVLVGRGLYGLKEWGYKQGNVSEIIEDLLAKKSPLSKHDITTGVLRQRIVKKGTISLNLQKNPHFVRVGRALYSLDLSKKPVAA